MVSRAVQFRFTLNFHMVKCIQIASQVVWFHNSKHLSVNTSVSRDIRTRGMLEDVAAPQMNKQTERHVLYKYVHMF